jgi:hypothetical protein
MNDTVISVLKDLGIPAITGLVGYYGRLVVENRKEQKKKAEEGTILLREHVDSLGSSIFQIQRDIRVYVWQSKFIDEQFGIEGFQDSDIYKDSTDLIKLAETRVLEYITTVKEIDTNSYKHDYPLIAEEIRSIKHLLDNLRRLLEIRSNGDGKNSTLEECEENLSIKYRNLMGNIHDTKIYNT